MARLGYRSAKTCLDLVRADRWINVHSRGRGRRMEARPKGQNGRSHQAMPSSRRLDCVLYASRTFRGRIEHVPRVREFVDSVVGQLPEADALRLVASELSANAIRHSRSGDA